MLRASASPAAIISSMSINHPTVTPPFWLVADFEILPDSPCGLFLELESRRKNPRPAALSDFFFVLMQSPIDSSLDYSSRLRPCGRASTFRTDDGPYQQEK